MSGRGFGGARRSRRNGGRGRRGRWSERLYGALLRLYPPSLRRAYGADMLQAFRDTLRHEIHRSGRPRGALRTWAITLGDLAASLPREWSREPRRGWRPGQRSHLEGQWRSGDPDSGWTVGGVLRAPGRGRAGGWQPATVRLGRGGEARYARSEMNMNEKFDKFTERARRVLSLSQEEAQRFNHNYIGTEHLLLGLVRERDGIAAKALANLGVELEKAREAVEFIIGRGDRIVLGEIGLTPRAKKVVELAVDEARRLGHHYIGTEHLLLGLIREGEGIAAGVLESLGVSLERARAAVMQTLGQPGVAPSMGPSMGPSAADTAGPGPVISAYILVCRDVAATQAFYMNYLGAMPVPASSSGQMSLDGAKQILRLPHGGPVIGLRAAGPTEPAPASPAGAGAVELIFFVRDAGAFWKELQQRAAPGLTELRELPGAPGMRAFTLTDPDGRTLRFHGIFRP